jgi:hypothetical protein
MSDKNQIQHELTQYHHQKLNRLRYIRLVTSVINKKSSKKSFYNVDIAKKRMNKETSASFKSNSELNLNDLNNNNNNKNDYGDLYLSKSTYFSNSNVSKSSYLIAQL